MDGGALLGTTIAGKYRVERALGEGGMGLVVAARHVELGHLVAIKVVAEAGVRSPKVVERFLREARAAAKLTGEHVVRVHDVGTLDSGAPFMVLEHLDGEDLGVYLEKHPLLPIERAVDATVAACDALAEAHALGIVHRDLKPRNLFYARRRDGSRCVKLLDFGISKVDGDGAETSAERVVGSPLYMAPEQLAAPATVGPRTDIWGLGTTLFELLAGRAPFFAKSVQAIGAGILHREAPALSTLRPDVPRGLDEVVARCLAKEPDDRFGSAIALARALAPYASAEGKTLVAQIERTVTEMPSESALGVPSSVSEAFATRSAPALPRQLLAAAILAAVAAFGFWMAGEFVGRAQRSTRSAATSVPATSAPAAAVSGSSAPRSSSATATTLDAPRPRPSARPAPPTTSSPPPSAAPPAAPSLPPDDPYDTRK